jgi:hypothetical protein
MPSTLVPLAWPAGDQLLPAARGGLAPPAAQPLAAYQGGGARERRDQPRALPRAQ